MVIEGASVPESFTAAALVRPVLGNRVAVVAVSDMVSFARALVLLAIGSVACGCGSSARVPAAAPSPTLGDSVPGSARCVPWNAPSARAGSRTGSVEVTAGGVVTLLLVEPEAYASSVSGPPPSAFPWLAGRSSDAVSLRSAAICSGPPVIMSLPARAYAFRARTPGRYRITAALNPAYRVPRMRPPLPRLRPVRITVLVKPRHPSRASLLDRYTVTASVLYRKDMGRPRACLTYLLSLPPAGCGGVPVSGYAFERVPGLVRYSRIGWATPELRMVGVWNGHTLRLTRPPIAVAMPEAEPAPPARCRGRSTAAARALATRVTRARIRLNLLELLPCGGRVWALVAVADARAHAFIRSHFGLDVVVAGWLRSHGAPARSSPA
jgi:hypothetical protein